MAAGDIYQITGDLKEEKQLHYWVEQLMMECR